MSHSNFQRKTRYKNYVYFFIISIELKSKVDGRPTDEIMAFE